MKFTQEQLHDFAKAGWTPDQIKEMLEFDTEIQKKLEQNENIKPEDGLNMNDPEQKKKEEEKPSRSAEDILDSLIQ